MGSCEKKTDSPFEGSLNEYLPLQVGKYIRYQLDSTVYIHFGQRDTVISYEAKDVVEEEITDNAGRQGFRVVRYLRDAGSAEDTEWTSALAYRVTPTRESIEILEDNLKFQKLRIPLKDGYHWHGNSFLPYSPYYTVYQFSNDEDIDIWDYTYHNVNQPTLIDGKQFDNTVTVIQVADSVNVPITYPDGLAYRNYWVEQYAKGIGLIYKEVAMWEYQPPNGGNPGYKTGFGIKMTILDHN